MDKNVIAFSGKFRDYQQRVLSNADKHLGDGRINIVAAPGSGKTVLGLELIRRIGSPCIVLSPTTAIREQWGQRFKELFLRDKEQFDSLFSNDLHKVSFLNSVTYQALYTAIEKVPENADGDTDCSDIDLFELMKANNIKTVCLDEAHHLKNEWHKALERFIASLDSDVKIIALTATPPYDSESNEWKRYISMCGEIDEEIFVPELVAQNTLCPHQDYIYFSFPTKEETLVWGQHKENAFSVISQIGKLPFISLIHKKVNYPQSYEELIENADDNLALLILLKHYGYIINDKIIRELSGRKTLPPFNETHAQRAVQYLLDGSILSDEQKDELISLLKQNSVIEKKKVCFSLGDRLKRTLISSVGKLQSIKAIVKSEEACMGQKLRMLILTDFINKDAVSKIETDEQFTSINIVSIFETLRREKPASKIGVLSGSLIILPDSIDLSAVKHSRTAIGKTGYSVVDFPGSTHRAVDFVGNLFSQGELQILIGTKSLLGEGWDSPCINSLILASFVGSYVLSNQMRGRAIRIDKQNPEKVSNIWHLVTVEPSYIFAHNKLQQAALRLIYDKDTLVSCDYDILKRRFDSFMGPTYTGESIESGIERITAISPPYNKKGIERINEDMLRLSADRRGVLEKWKSRVGDGRFAVSSISDIPKENRIPIYGFFDFGLQMILCFIYGMILRSMVTSAARSSALTVGGIMTLVILTVILFNLTKRLVTHFSPARSIKLLGNALYNTMTECQIISPSAKVETIYDKKSKYVIMYLRNASINDQNIFNNAMTQMLSPIANPRYIIIKKSILGMYNYTLSFACPEVLGKKKEYAQALSENLRKLGSRFEPVYTHREGGRKLILRCRNNSYITYNDRCIKRALGITDK